MQDTIAEHIGHDDDDASLLSLVSGLALGLIVGAITAILLAPKPGDETRHDVIELLPNR